MKDLFSLVEKYGTDKTLSGYTHTYSDLFQPIQNDVTSVLEIGLGTLNPNIPSSFAGNVRHFDFYKPGGSLRVWRDYFPNAQVYGVDIAKDCMFVEDRIQTFLFDSSESEYTEYYLSSLKFDIIIDDGNHDPKYQVKTLRNLLPKLKENGYYVIEDIGGYSGTEELLIEYLDEFNDLTKGYEIINKGNHIVIFKQRKESKEITNQNKNEISNLDEIKNQLKFLSKEDRNKLLEFLSKPQIDIQNKDLTVVTGLWNISRPGRDFSHYIEHFKKFLEIPINMFIYIPAEYEYIVWEKRSKENTYVRIYELSDIKNIYSPFWSKTQEIRTNPEWFNQTGEHGWLKGSPQASLEWYNPIVQSKMFMLNDVTVWNPFDTKYFIWLDAGITNTVYEKFLTENRALDKINPYLESFLFLSYPYEANYEIHGFDFQAMNRYAGQKVEYVCRGGLFGGSKEMINQANAVYYSMLDRSLSDKYMGTEESIFTLMSYIEPEKYRRYALDGNGLIVKFVQALLDDKVELEPIPENRRFLKPKNLDTSGLKTSLYMLTFNFPQQVRHTLETWRNSHPEFLSKTRKILIDNSNNPEAIEGNKQICDEYGFEHIVTGENLGINRGRLYAAKHFQESDSDYYIFLEDDMGTYTPEDTHCRNGFRHYTHGLYEKIHKIMLKEEYDFLKLSFTEVYMDNQIQCSWYNVPQMVRTEVWPEYDRLPVQGLDPNCPRTTFNKIDNMDGLTYIDGEVYYCNWPMIVSKEGNKKMFLDTEWAHPYEQTWMSYMFQETLKNNLKPAVLLASPIKHNRIAHYEAHERREN